MTTNPTGKADMFSSFYPLPVILEADCHQPLVVTREKCWTQFLVTEMLDTVFSNRIRFLVFNQYSASSNFITMLARYT